MPISTSAGLEPPDGVVKGTFRQLRVAGQARLPYTDEELVGLHSAHEAAERLRDEAREHDIGLQLVDAGEGAEVLPSDPAKPVNPDPGLPDLGLGCAFTEVAAVSHAGRP